MATRTKTETQPKPIAVCVMGFAVDDGPGGLPWACQKGTRLTADHEMVQRFADWFVEDGSDDATINRATRAAFDAGAGAA